MLDFSPWLIILSIVLISCALLVFGISIIPWCRRLKNKAEQPDNFASWSRIAILHHDTTAVSPLPPYFFVNGVMGYDKYSTLV